jgi:hypothetical protein
MHMKKLLILTAASACLFAAPASADYFIRDDATGQRFVVDTTTNAETVLLLEENGAAPSNCPAGSFWQNADGTIFACDDPDSTFILSAPAAGTMMPSGDPWPENAMLMLPPEAEDSGQQSDPTSATEAASGGANSEDNNNESDGEPN